jgi:surface protein
MHHTITKRSLNLLTTLFFILTLFTFTTSSTEANFTATDFITTWDTENTGTSASNQITIPGTGSGYSYSIYWESLSSSTATGTIATSTSASQTITFPEPGQYKVAIKGTYPRIYFNNGGDKLKILTVEQWGSPAWTSMASAFYGCASLTVPATDAPNLSGVTSMALMFAHAYSLNQPLNHWDVSNVTNMSQMFQSATSFNQPLSNWNTSNVTTMLFMFRDSNNFNQDISMWSTSNVTSMRQMFYNTSFNQPINNWNVSKVTNIQLMFYNTTFNQPLNSWNTASITDMYGVFFNNSDFNQDLSAWNISNVTTMGDMFLNATLSTQNLDSTLQGWAAQSLNSNVPFHLGLKTYSSTGQTALDTLRDTYNWIITEQYQAEYQDGNDYTLSGTTTQSPINLNGTTTAVEVTPNNRCTFLSWSDNSTENPRTDTLTDNLTVSATVECHNPTTSTSAKGRANKLEALGNQDKAEAIRQEYNLTPNSSLHTAIATIASLTTNPTITNNPETKAKLITVMQTLVVILEGMRGE